MTRPATADTRLVIIGLSNILSDLFDCALALRLPVGKVVIHHDESPGARDLPARERIAAYAGLAAPPLLQPLAAFVPEPGERYLLGPTSPQRRGLAQWLAARYALPYPPLIHPTAYVSPLARIDEGVFVGANSVIGPGAHLKEHVFVNRGVTIGHDTVIGAYSRVQPGSNLGGLSVIGEGVTIGLGATLLERLHIGSGTTVGAGAVVLRDVPEGVLAVGVPATIKRTLDR